MPEPTGDPTPDADPNPDYTPRDPERIILDYLAAEHRANPWMIRKRTGWRGQKVNDVLQPLLAAKWLVRPTVYDRENDAVVPAHAMYQYNADGVYSPRPLVVSLPRGAEPAWEDRPYRECLDIVRSVDSPRRLRTFYDIERKTKNRSTVREAIEQRLRALGADVPTGDTTGEAEA